MEIKDSIVTTSVIVAVFAAAISVLMWVRYGEHVKTATHMGAASISQVEANHQAVSALQITVDVHSDRFTNMSCRWRHIEFRLLRDEPVTPEFMAGIAHDCGLFEP
jgi:hypothetical protein